VDADVEIRRMSGADRPSEALADQWTYVTRRQVRAQHPTSVPADKETVLATLRRRRDAERELRLP